MGFSFITQCVIHVYLKVILAAKRYLFFLAIKLFIQLLFF